MTEVAEEDARTDVPSGAPLDAGEALDPSSQCMLLVRAGDEGAFAELFDRWAGPLLYYLRRMVKDAALAEELVQESFLRVYRARQRYEPRARFSTWLYRIGTRLALNELRRPRLRRPHQAIDPSASRAHGPALLPDPQPGPDEALHARREMAALSARLEALPERQRAALWLVVVDGLAYREVAQVLDVSEGAVKSLVHRARSQLAREPRAAARERRSGGGPE